MLDELVKELETDAVVKFKNGRNLYGIILDYLKGENEVENFRFVPNYHLDLYRASENPSYVITLDRETVSAVDICLK